MKQAMQHKGLFITVEGVEGVGKSTAMHFLQHWLTAHQIDFVQTREPGGTLIAEQIRELFLKRQAEVMHADTELLMVFAARAQHLQQFILPAIAQGKTVICDRFTDASYAYQGAGRGISTERIGIIENWVQDNFRPDCVILLDAPVALCLERTKQRGALDRIEVEQAEFFEKVRQTYLNRAAEAPKRYRIIDASQTLENVQQQLSAVLAELYKVR
jgi:dTMP kinase